MDNLRAPHPRSSAGLFTKIALALAGMDEATLRHCPDHDWGVARALGAIVLFTGIYIAGLLSVISHKLFSMPGHIRPELILGSLFIAGFIILIDSFMIIRPGWQTTGLAELKRGGLDLTTGALTQVKAMLLLGVRLLLAFGQAAITATFVVLLIYAPDIANRVQSDYLRANQGVIDRATELVDGGIRRATDAVTAETPRVASLSSQVGTLRQAEIDPSASDPQVQHAQEEVAQLTAQKATADNAVRDAERFAADELAGIKGAAGNSGQVGNGPRRRAAMERVANARKHAEEINDALNAARTRLDALRKRSPSGNESMKRQFRDQRVTFEGSLDAESAKLAALKADLDSRIRNRESAIRSAVENSPDHVGLANGLLGQIAALEKIADENTKIFLIIILIDLVSLGLELSAVLAKASYVPTTYAALLASNAFMRAAHIADDINAELRAIDRQEHNQPESPPPPKPANDNKRADISSAPDLFGNSTTCAPPPRRGRGRPRKYPPPA